MPAAHVTGSQPHDALSEGQRSAVHGAADATSAGRRSAEPYLAAVRRDLSWRRFAFVGGVAVLVATELLSQPDLLELWDAADIALALGRYSLELLWIASALLLTFTLIDRSPIGSWLLRVAAFGFAYGAVAFGAVVAVGVVEFYPHVDGVSLQLSAAESLRWSLLAGFLSAVFVLHRSALSTARLASEIEEAREALKREQLGMQLQLLQAQIEPHFLFNTLANMRRLYRTRPGAGAHMIDCLLRYLRAALPQIRQSSATLGDELELVRAYLELVGIRMGRRLRYSITAEPTLLAAAFPPMLLMTLIENAVKHGLEPAPQGGTVAVAAHVVDGELQVVVADDGVGLGGADTGGTGVGLANIRRQLSLRFGNAAALTIAGRLPHGVACSLRLQLQFRAPPRPSPLPTEAVPWSRATPERRPSSWPAAVP